MFDSVQVEWLLRDRWHCALLPLPEAVTIDAAP